MDLIIISAQTILRNFKWTFSKFRVFCTVMQNDSIYLSFKGIICKDGNVTHKESTKKERVLVMYIS